MLRKWRQHSWKTGVSSKLLSLMHNGSNSVDPPDIIAETFLGLGSSTVVGILTNFTPLFIDSSSLFCLATNECQSFVSSGDCVLGEPDEVAEEVETRLFGCLAFPILRFSFMCANLRACETLSLAANAEIVCHTFRLLSYFRKRDDSLTLATISFVIFILSCLFVSSLQYRSRYKSIILRNRTDPSWHTALLSLPQSLW